MTPHLSGKDDRSKDAVPTIGMDYCFPTSRREETETQKSRMSAEARGEGQTLATQAPAAEEQTLATQAPARQQGEEGAPIPSQCGPVLVMKDLSEGNVFSMVTPAKGPSRPWVAKRCARWIESLGRGKVILKTDGEPAIVSLAGEIKAQRADVGETVLENSEAGESQSNGSTESAVGIVEGMIRTFKSALEERIGAIIRLDAPVIPWLVEHAGHVYSRYRVGPDGRTPLERNRGKRIGRPVCEFAEQVLYMPLKASRGGKADPKFSQGIYLGTLTRTGETVIGTSEGVTRARTVRRLPADKRWSAKALDELKGTPWAPAGDDEEAPIGIRVELPGAGGAARPMPMNPEVPLQARRVYLKKGDFEQHGVTKGCAGCAALRRGEKKAVNHSEACRRRMTDLIKDTPDGAERVERAERRRTETAEDAPAKRFRFTDEETGDGLAAGPVRGPEEAPTATAASSSSARRDPEDVPMEDEGTQQQQAPTQQQQAPMEQDSGAQQSAASGSGAPIPSGKRPDSSAEEARTSATQNPAGTSAAKKARLQHLGGPAEDDIPMQEGSTTRRPDVSEVYSPPRVTAMARAMGMNAGWALDLRTVDANGRKWNFEDPSRRTEALRLVRETTPRVLIGSPMCTAFSQLQALNRRKLGETLWRARIEEATRHLVFCCALYFEQMKRGDYFLHEHPAGASSWQTPAMVRLSAAPGVVRVTGDMCAHGMWQTDKEGPGLVRKPTGFMTNSPCLAERVGLRCRGGHRHIPLLNGRARQAQEYPDGLCRAICLGIQEQLRQDNEKRNEEKHVEHIKNNMKDRTMEAARSRSTAAVDNLKILMHDTDTPQGETLVGDDLLSMDRAGHTWDDVKGGWLDPKLVTAARREEVEYVRKHDVYVRVPRAQCWAETGRAPVKTGWADTNKGTAAEPTVRSRWVAKEYNTGARPDLFAGTSPLEGVKLVISSAASDPDPTVCGNRRRAARLFLCSCQAQSLLGVAAGGLPTRR